MQNRHNRNDTSFGVGLPTSRPSHETLQFAMEVEKLGFDQVWVGDHYHSRSPFLLLATIAAHTDQVKLCTGVTNPFQTSPAVLASMVLTLDELTSGGVLLGLGVGDEITLRQIGVYPSKPVAAMRQCINVIRDLWQGKPVSGLVGVSQWNRAQLRISTQKNLPIYVGAQNLGMIRLAFEVGDGLVMNASSPLDYRWIAQIGAKKRSNVFQTIAYLILEIDNEPSSLLRQLLSQIVAGASKSMLERHEISLETTDRVVRFVRQGRYPEAGQALTKRMIDAFAVTGSLSMVERRIEDLKKERVDGFIFGGPLAKDRREGLQKLAEIVLSF
jgi:5,10-methylenetetrahydromethanopterin reductase